MNKKDASDALRDIIKKYSPNEVEFTKSRLIDWLCERNNSTIDKMKYEILNPIDLVYTEKQKIEYQGITEERWRCYFVYSGNRGRCYVIRFNARIKVITVFPLGRTTLRKYRKRFK